MTNILLLVDCQYDFMEGGKLPVQGAIAKMDSLTEYVKRHGREFDRIFFTLDFHPFRHCSFKESGIGEWPAHCIEHSKGAAIYEPLLMAVEDVGVPIAIIPKGISPFAENYSVFGNPEAQRLFANFCCYRENARIVVAGIALDYCVKETLKDGITLFPASNWELLYEYCPCIGGLDAAAKMLSETMALASKAMCDFKLAKAGE